MQPVRRISVILQRYSIASEVGRRIEDNFISVILKNNGGKLQ